MSTSEDPDSVEPDSVEAVKSDIEATRAELVETVTELSDRLNPTKRLAAVTQTASDTAKDIVEQAGDVTKDTAAKAPRCGQVGRQTVAANSATAETQRPAGSSLMGLVLMWRLWRRRPMIKLFYKPWGMLAGMIGGALAGALFKRVWKLLSGEETAPTPTDRSRGWIEVVLAAGLEGAVFGGVKAFVDRGGAASFEKATGTWPGRESDAD